jgi:hypothetical protein
MNVSVSRDAKLATLIFALAPLLLTLNARSAGPGNRACFIEPHPVAQGDLEDGQQGVLSRPGRFDYGTTQYRFEALSLWGFDRPNPEKTCLRYELKNLSGQKLEAVVWKDAGIPFMDIENGGRARWATDSRPPYPAVDEMSEVKAFARSSELVRAYVPVVRRAAAAAAGAGIGFAEFDVQEFMSEAVKALDQANLPTRRITAVSRDALPDRVGSLVSHFNNGLFAFEHISTAQYEGQSISINQTIKFSRRPAETEISAPYISALNSLTAPVNADAVTRFATMIGEMKGQWNRAGDIGKNVSAPIGSGVPALFIVKHPVTVRARGGILCLFVTSYSVLPVEAEANYCAAQR